MRICGNIIMGDIGMNIEEYRAINNLDKMSLLGMQKKAGRTGNTRR